VSCHRLVVVILLALYLPCRLATAAELMDADTVLARTAPQLKTTAAPEPSKAEKLLQDVLAYRVESATLAPDVAVNRWLDLFDRAKALQVGPPSNSYASFDIAAGAPVGLRSVLAALPPPAAWSELRSQASKRVTLRPDDSDALALRLLSELLVQDRKASEATLLRIEALSGEEDKEVREPIHESLATVRTTLIEVYGDDAEVADLFKSNVAAASENAYSFSVDTPDLVGLLGEKQAEQLLRDALRRPVLLDVAPGSATRALAKRLALEEIATLGRPQWQLVDFTDTIPFYEAMRARFGGGKATDADTDLASVFDPYRTDADAYYFLALVAARRQADAQLALQKLTGDSELSLPTATVTALKEAGHNQALVEFLHHSLRAHPELDAWSVYLEQSAYVGRHEESLALLDELLSRTDLPAHLRSSLRRSRAAAQLAADQVEPALKSMSQSLQKAPLATDKKLAERVGDAVKLASLARVLEKPALVDPAFAYAERGIALMLPQADQHSELPDLASSLYAELRHQDRDSRAQALAIAVLNRPRDPAVAAFAALRPDPLDRAALIELVSIYDSAMRHADALRLVDGSSSWGARDVRELAAEKDSLGAPFGAFVARALKSEGNAKAALATTEQLLHRLPGHDGGYALLVDLLGSDAAESLDERYGHDPFEERPLIWKAIALQKAGRLTESEASVRAAIAIDPSDGEQGRDDRMRAYAVLADLLAAKGDEETAAIYRGAVAAIRLSEQADELHKLGLYRRAFDTYQKALDQFSDAYCIQSRLAVQLSKQGLHEQALVHYRRAYELMPDSFGRVESHCFGCESVFVDRAAQGVAEQVFTRIVEKTPSRPQAHYMLAYLRIEQSRFREALDELRLAVGLDGDYLNAWKKLHELGEKTYIPAAERDIARLKLVELDPLQRHVKYQLSEVGDLRALWKALETAKARHASAQPNMRDAYPLAGSAAAITAAIDNLPEAMQAQTKQYFRALDTAADPASQGMTPAQALARHALVQPVLLLLGDSGEHAYGYE
jgi:tetratricopeptide (TPR) repeat protein